ncbi:MAG TPA: hypothetical protein DCL77_09040, partial [Prolixibacteraceae bacterium]|nr:hypothetical protein [Prolixibacteraceae bacterium]
ASTWVLDTAQPLHAYLTAIAGLPPAPGLLRTDGSGNWTLDATPFVAGTPWQGEGYLQDSEFTSNGLMTRTGAGTYSITATTAYSLAAHTHAGVYAALAGSLTQAFNASTLTIETGAYDWIIGNNAGGLYFSSPPTSSSVLFNGNGITADGFINSTATADTLAYFDVNKFLKSLPTASYPNLTELSYLKGITGAINSTYAQIAGSATQAFDTSQLNVEAGTYPYQIKKVGSDLTFTQYTGTAATFNTTNGITTPGITISGETASQILWLDASKRIRSLSTATYPTIAQLAFVRGVTSAIQTQITARALLAGATTQAFSTASLTLGNSTGNSPILTLYGSSASVFSTIKTTNGNLHIDAYGGGNALYLNYYTGSGGINFGNGATGTNANVSAAGLYTGTGLQINGNANVTGTIETSGTITGSEIYRTSSRDQKYDIQSFSGSAMCIINKTKILSYRMKADYSFALGFIAEETHHWLSGDEQKHHIFGNHLAILTKAVQEEDTKIIKLQKEVIELKTQIKELKHGRG